MGLSEEVVADPSCVLTQCLTFILVFLNCDIIHIHNIHSFKVKIQWVLMYSQGCAISPLSSSRINFLCF